MADEKKGSRIEELLEEIIKLMKEGQEVAMNLSRIEEQLTTIRDILKDGGGGGKSMFPRTKIKIGVRPLPTGELTTVIKKEDTNEV